MPTLAHVPHGKITALWGTAHVRSPNGKMRLLKLGDMVQKGDVILTSQDGIVQISGEDGEPHAPRLALQQPDGAQPKAALVPDEIEQVIQALNNNDPGVAPAAGVSGGGDGSELSPGLRVDRVIEVVTPQEYAFSPPDRTTPTFTTGNQIDGSPAGTEPAQPGPFSGAEDSRIPVALVGGGSTAASVTVTSLPPGSALFLPDGVTPVTVGQVLTPAQAAALVFVPAPDFNGATQIGFAATDAQGNPTGAAQVAVTVTPVNDAPVAVGNAITTDEDTPVTIAVLGNDSDAEGDKLSVTAINGSPVAVGSPVFLAQGSVSLNADGTLTFTPAADYNGPVAFDYTVSDGQGGSSTASVAVSVNPVLDVTTVSLAASPAVAEGGSIVYTASLTEPAQAPLTLTLTNGAVITVAAGASSGSVAVPAPADDAHIDAGTVSAGIASATGGGFESLVVAAAPAVTAVADTLDTTTLSLTASPNVAEGGQITYTASLTAAAQSPVTVTLSNGATITIAAGASTGSVSVAAPADDVYTDGGNVVVTLAGASGGNFENLALNGNAAVTSVADTLDTTTVSLTASPAVAEGGSIVYTASLTSVAQSPVSVTLSNGALITIAAGSATGSVSVPAPADDVFADAGNVSASIASASGGNFENLVADATPAITGVTDTLDTTTVSLTASPAVAEGGVIVYTASLTAPAQSPVTVTLSNGAVITIAAGASTGSVNVAAPADDVFADTGSVSATIAGATGGNFEQLQVNTAAATTTVSDTLDSTTLSLSATPAVAEGGSIVYTASLTAPAQSPVTVTLSNGAVIAIAAGASSGTVSVPAPADDAHLDAGSVSATISSASGGNFEQLSINPAAATTAVTDTIDTTTVSLLASPSVAEGGQIVYTASLSSAAQSPVTVTLSNGAVITIAAGASSGSVNVAAPAEDVYADAGNVSATIAGASGGNFENLAVNPAAAVTTITDTTDITTVSLTASASVAEGGQIVYTASLTAPAQSPVTVALSNGATITIAAGTSSASVNVAAPADDVFVDAGSVSATIASASGGNFEQLSVNPAAATTAVTDTADTTTVSLLASASAAEGGQITYTASLTAAAQSVVIVTLSNGAVITIPAGASSGTVNVNAPGEDVYADAGTVSATIAGASGGGFENLAVNPAAATTAVSDTLDVTTVSLGASASVAEGGQITYTASLTSAAQSAVTVTLSNGAVITIPAGANSGSVSVNAPAEDVYADAGSVSASIATASGGNFEQLAINPAAATTSVSDTIDTTTVSLSATPSVAEGGQVTYTASLTAAAQSPVTVTLSNGATITIAAGTSTGSVSINAPADDVYADAGNVSATITGATGGGFEQLAVNPAAASTAVTDTLDTTTVSLTASPTVAEGGTIVYTASLTAPAQSAVTVTLTNGAVINIAAGASVGTVNVPAPTDDAHVDGSTLSVGIGSASGGGFEQLAVNPASASTTVTDTLDTTTLSLAATPAVAEGGFITYTASLTAPAQTAMVVTLSNGSSINIAAGASSGSVSVAAPTDDAYADAGNVSVQITGASGGNFEQLSVNGTPAVTAVSDTLDATTVSLAATPAVAEGGSITYTVTLGAPAQTAMVVTLSNGASIGIPAGSSAGSVSVAAPTDDVYADAGNVSVQITSASGGNFEQLSVNTTPAVTAVSDTLDATTVSLTASPTVAEGGTIVYTASLGAPAQSPVTVTLSNGATITIAAGSSTGDVTLPAPADDVYADGSTLSVTITGTSGGGFEQLVASTTPADTAITDTVNTTTVSLSGSTSVAEGGAAGYTVSLTSPAATAVTVTLAYSGTAADGTDFTGVTTVTIPAGASSAGFDIATLNDTLAEGAENFTVSLVSASGGNFESLVVSGSNGSVTTGIVDDDAAALSLSATPSLTEAGGTITYTATLTQAPVSPLTVTLSNGATLTIAAGAFSGTVDVPVAASDDVYVDASSVSAAITATSGGGITVVVDATPAVTAIGDTIDATTVSLAATPSVTEGGSIVYTAALTSAAQSPVTVTLDNGATITIAAGATSGTVSVNAGDDVYAGGASVSARISTATGGNFENLVADTTPATTSVSDTVDTTTVSLTASPSAAEGGQITYTASLTSVALSAVTVTLSNGASIVIPAGSSSATVDVAAPGDDVYVDAGSVSATITSATGGGFEQLAIDPAAANTTITDTADSTTVSLSASPTVAEGGSITYTANLTAPAQTDVTVALSNGAVITIVAGASTGTVSVNAPGDDVYADAGDVSATITSATGGNFENLLVNPAAATTTVTDTADTTTVSLAATPSVAEGGQITYTASLTALAQSAVTVALSNGATITIPAGANSASVSVNAPADDVYADAGNVSATITAATGGGFESLAVNPAAATTSVTDTVDDTTVSLTATPTVAEGGQITYTASLGAAAQSPVTVTLSNGAVINIAAGASSGSVSINAPGDDVLVDAGNVSATISSATGGGFESLLVNPAAAATAVTDTIDTTTVSLAATPSVAEGGQITYTASLTSAAQSPVTVTLSNGATITIAAGASTGSVSINAPGDDVYADAGTVSATITGATGGNFEQLAVNPAAATTTVTDTPNDTTVSLTASPSVAEGGQITYTASLTSATQSPVTVTLSNGATITIAAGANAGSVSVNAPADDVYTDAGSVAASISSATGGGFENLVLSPTAASTTITDTVDDTTVSLAATPSVAEGGSIVYTASLTSPAQGAVTVTLSNGAVITIAAGASTGSVNVPVADDVYQGGGSVSATITSASGGNFENLRVNPASADTTITDTVTDSTVTLSASPSVAEGGQITYTASLTSPAQTAVTVTLSNGATIAIAAGASSGTVSVSAPTDDVYVDAGTVSASIASATGGNFENLLVNPAAASTAVTDTTDTTTVSLSASPSVAEGGQITYTASLTAPAQTAVTVTLDNGATLTIAAGASSASVNVAAPTDDVYVDAGSVSASIASASGGNFEQLAVNTAPAITAITDTADTTTVSLSASPSVAEGGQITYTASLTSPAQTAVTVTLSNGATIAIAAGASSGTVSVNAPADDVYVDAGNVSATISAATGGNFEQLAINPAAATTAITDTVNTTTVSLSASASVAEGGQIVYTASLTSVAQGPVTVTLSNGAVITIPAGSSAASVNVDAPADDVYVDAGSVSATIASASGGNFEQLAVNPAAASTTITDTVNTSTVSLTASSTVAEGGQITYTASLTAAAQSPVTVTLSNGATITIPVGASSSSVNVAAPADDVYADAGSVSAAISSASGGNFEQLAVNPAAATTTVTDTADTTTVSLAASPAVAEGGQITYTASLTAAAQSAVTVTLDNGAVITIAAGASTGSVSVNAPSDDVYLDAGSVSASIASASGGNFEQLVVNPAAATTTVSDTLDDTTVSLAATPSVAEGGTIVYTASLTAAAQSAVTVTLSNGAAITIAAGASSGTVNVPAPTDDVYVDAGNVSATISTATGGNFERLLVDGTAAVTAVSDTTTDATVSLSATPSVAEGGQITYTASLTAAAQSPVTVNLSNGASITIAAGASTGSVSVPAPGDDVYADAGNVSVNIATATGGNFENLLVNAAAAVTSVTDTLDTTTVSLTATPTVAEGGQIVYTASLNNPAQSAVTVTLSNGATITIAAGASTGSVNVPAPGEDVYADAGSVSATIATVSGGGFENLVVNPAAAVTSVSDTIDTTTVSLTASASVAEGGQITYTASLTSPAQSAVTVTLSNGATITIAAGASSSSVSVNAPGDDVYADAGSVSATIASASGGNFENLAINPAAASTSVTDTIDTTTVSLTASASVVEGGQITYTASLTAAAQSDVTVTLSNGATITIPAGASSGTVDVAAPGDDVYADAGSVSATITAASGGSFEQLAVNPAAATTTITDTANDTTVSLAATPSVAEGGQIVYTASLTNAAQSPVTVTLSNGATITIAAGASSGTVNVPAPGDDVYADAGSVSATIGTATGGNFENLVIDGTAATTSVTDTVDTTTVSLTASPTVAEGGQITYTASLTSAAQSAVTVTLSNGAVITIPAGASSAAVSVNAPGDDVYADAGSVSATISAASGGGFEQLAVNPAAATTAITDTVATTTVSLAATASVAEGGQITYTASLNNPAQTPVTVTLSNGATLTIAAGASSASVSVNAPTDDVYADAGSVSATIASASGGNFEDLAVNPAAATTTITDTIDQTTVSLTASPSVAEGGQITYTASLTSAAQGAVTVTLSNGATITIAAGANSGTVSVPAPGDDVYVDAGSVSAAISSATGGGFEQLVVNPAAATTAITDTSDTTTVSLAATANVAEGGFIVYTASLTAAAQSAVTVTLSNGATITIAAGASSGSVNVAAPTDDVYTDAGIVSATISSASGGNFENLVVDGTAAVTAVADTLDTTTVSLAASNSVAEGGSIVYTANLTSPAQSPVTVNLSNGATITIAAGASSGSVSVAAPADDVYVDAGSVSATISSASGGNFENLVVNGAAATTTITDTVDTTTVSLTASPSVAEGGQITYTASLTSAAQSPVTVTLSNGATITIAAGTSVGSVNVAAPADDVYLDAGSVSATISSATGGNFEQLAVNPAAATTTITDTADTSTVSLAASASVAEGGTIVYTASLTSVAQTPVTVTLSNGATITIAAGASSGSVNVAAPADDVYRDAGSVSATISSASGGNFEQLAVNPAAATTSITDTADTSTVSLTASASVAEGGTIVYTASLTSVAQTPVTVTLSNGATITIAAGASAGSVNVAAPTDDVYLDAGNVSATISSASGGNFEQLAVNPAAAVTSITDTVNSTTVSLSASPSVAEGGQIVYTASLTSAAQTAVTVTLSNGATLTIAAGASSGSVNVAAPSDDVYVDAGSVSATISSATGGNFEQLAINPAAATTSITDTVNDTTVSLTASPSVVEGGQIVYTASLTSVAQSAVTVTLSNGATLTIAAGASSGSVSVAAPGDDVYVDAGNVSATISSATGGNFENLAVNSTAAVTAVTDDADVTTLSLTGTTSVAEGAGASYTLSLTSPAQTAVTVTLGYSGTATDGSDYTGVTTVTIPAGSSSVNFSIATLDDSATESTENFTVSLVSATGGNFESLALSGSNNAVTTSITDNDAPPAIDLDADNSSGAGGTGYAATFTENGAAVAIADADVAITDVDSSALTGATVTLTNAQAGDVLAAGALPAGISASVSGNTVTLSGAASLASYQAAIRAISFSNTSENPSTTPRSITVTVTDGTSNSSPATTTVNVVAVNDAPTHSVPAAQTLAEDTTRVFSSANGNAITVADVDSDPLTVVVSVTNGTLGATAFAGAAIIDNGTGRVTIVGSPAAINGALNGLTYTPAADFNGSTTLTVATSDGVAAPVVSTVPITVTPVADITGDTASTNEDTAVTIAVLGTDNFESADRTITAVNGSAITAGGSAVAVANGSVALNADGTLTFTPAAHYNGAASFTYTVTSGGVTETATVNVTVNAVNDAPALDLDNDGSSGAAGADYMATFTENGTAVSIGDADVRITDVDNATLAGATITLTNAQAGDVLAAGALPPGITATVSGNSVTLSGSASLAAYESAIRAITFSNTSENPNTTPRTLQVTVNDGAIGSNLATATINVVSVNDAPVAVPTPASGLEDAAFIAVNLAGTDVDGSIASVRVTALPANGTLYLADGVTQVVADAALTPAEAAGLRFVPTADWSGSTQLSFTVTDNQGLTSAVAQNPITVTPVADQPTLAAWTTTQVNVTEDWQDNNTSAGQMVWTSSDGYVEVNTQPSYNLLQNPNTALTPANNRVAEIEVDAGSANWIQTTVNAPLAGQVMEISFDTLRRTLSGTADSNTQSFDVIWNGTVVGTYNPGTGAWLSPTLQVTSIAGTNTLRFSATDQTGSIGAVIDHVTVRTVADGYEDTAVRLPSLAGAAVFGDIPDNSEQHTLSLTGIPVGATVSDGTRSFTATAGNTSVVIFNEDDPGAASGGANWNLATLTVTPPLNFNGNLSLTATATAVELANGSTASATTAITLVIAPVNDAPVAQASAVTAAEDTLYTFTLADFVATDVDAGSSVSSVTITSLPASGDLYFNGAPVTTTGLVVTAADFAAGRLQFRGDADESGSNAYGQAGTGNQRNDYASFNFTVTDNQGAASNSATMTVDVAPVADATTITGASTALPASTGLTMTRHDNVGSLDGTTSQTLANIEPAVEADAVAATSTVTGITTAAGVSGLGNDDAYRVSGFVYLQAGQTYTFGGTFEDTLTLEIGGRRLAGFAHDGSTSDDESFSGASFTPAVSGYYSVELITYNVGGDAGFANLNVSVNGAAAVPFNTTNFNLYANASTITASGTAGSFVAATDTGTGSNAAMSTAGHYQRRGAPVVQGEEVLLPTLAATFGDSSDNSERHTITLDLSGAPVGTRVFVDANGDGIPDDGRIFTVTAGSTSVVVFDEDDPAAAVGGANWALGSIVVDTPASYTGNFTINAVTRADEVASGSVVNSSSSTLAIPVAVVTAQNLAPTVENTSATVSEEGLAAGIADTTGTSDTTDSATVSGTVNVADTLDTTADSVTSITLLPPGTSYTSNGVAITWTGSGTGTLVGTAGGSTIATLTIDNAGNYNFTLSGPIDHSGANVEDVLGMNFGVVASDGVNSGSGTLTINVEDDSPTVLPTTIAAELAVTDTNLMIVLDVSGSMGWASGIPGLTRLQAAVQSISTLLDRYDEFGSVAVRLVTFSSSATASGAAWMTVADAKAALASLVANGGTNYDAGINTAMTAFGTTTGRISGAQSVSYFFSDGAPTSGQEIGAADEATWTTFLDNNQINSFAIGMGTGVPQAPMDPIAYNGQNNEATNAVVVTDFNQLDTVLAGTIQNPVAGPLVTGGTFGAGALVGSDGGEVRSITIDGATYTYSASGGGSITVTGGADNGSFDTATDTLTVTTAAGGQFEVDMDDGTYRYSAPNALASSIVERMDYVVSDRDGDTQASSVTVEVDRTIVTSGTTSAETITGTSSADLVMARQGDDIIVGGSGRDVLLGGAGNDQLSGGDGDDSLSASVGADTLDGGSGDDRLIGGAGNDQLTGGLGADVFAWQLVDRGTGGAPASDNITDFNVAAPAAGGDTLDLRDLLQNETSSNLSQYLDFDTTSVPGSTVIRISSTGGFASGTYSAAAEDQRITLQGVDLRSSLGLGGGASDDQIIQELLNRGKLITDAT